MNNAMTVKDTKNLPDKFKTILLVQLGDIGDVVLTTPTIRALKESYPGSRLIVCVREKAKGIIEGDRWADGIISVNKQKRSILYNIRYQTSFFRELRKYRFDLVIELRTGTRGSFITFISGAKYKIGRYAADGGFWRNRIFTHLVNPDNEGYQYSVEHNLNIISPLGLEINIKTPEITITSEIGKKISRVFKKEGINPDKPIIVFHPFSLWKYKEWRINHCVELIEYLYKEYDCIVIITGAPEERAQAGNLAYKCSSDVHNFAGRTSIIELAGVLNRCRLFIGVDTAPAGDAVYFSLLTFF